MQKQELSPNLWRLRGLEKKQTIFEWICIFHYSNLAILKQLLQLNHRNNSAYFRKLIDEELLDKVFLPTLREPVYILTNNFISMHSTFEFVSRYSTAKNRISASVARHNLCVQRAVLNRREHWDEVIPERLLKEIGKKIPDAILIKAGRKTALEIELTQKMKSKIYLAFTDHARAFRDNHYQAIEYVFDDAQIGRVYESIFNEERWPVFRFNALKNRYVEDKEMFVPSTLAGFRESMKFTVERLLHD